MKKYDCTEDVLKHRVAVQIELEKFYTVLVSRGIVHDASKLLEPEKVVFDEYVPKLKEYKFGSPEYENALKEMNEMLKHHYENNRHHPEHFKNGIWGMNLYDLVEMFCDWIAASKKQGNEMDFNYLQSRFNLSDQLCSILENTVKAL